VSLESRVVAALSGTQSITRVSIVAPMLNEAEHVETLVADIAAQDYEGESELLVADGGSTDGSVELLEAAANKLGLDATILENQERWVSQALNMCIRRARGDLIVRVDCHSRYGPDYVRGCAIAAEETGAEEVGCVFAPRGRTHTERAVACAMESPFGGVHWTRHGSSGRVEVDTVPYGAFRPAAFSKAGLFDETFVRDEDEEFNLRLRLAGGRIVLDPAIQIFYVPRGSFRGVFRQYFEYGLWKPAVMRKHWRIVSARSLVPFFFVASLVVLGPLAPRVRAAARLLAVEVAAYSLGAIVFGALAVRRKHEQWRLLPQVLAVFPTFHVAYGLGMVAGWGRIIGSRS
jgi:succinoglycan biosynthesis protein ExoA